MIEDDYDGDGIEEVEQMKLIKTDSPGLTLMRGTYTLVCLFWVSRTCNNHMFLRTEYLTNVLYIDGILISMFATASVVPRS